jgi:hypothetical protein
VSPFPTAQEEFYGNFVTMVAQEWRHCAVGQYAREWLHRTGCPRTFFAVAVDTDAAGRDFANLPLDYYAPGNPFFFIKNRHDSSATSLLLQSGIRANHVHQDAGNFQIRRGDRWLTKETTGYATVAAGFRGQGTCPGMATLNHNGIVFTGRGWTLGNNLGYPDGSAQVIRLESRPDYAYMAVDLSLDYKARSSDFTNADGSPRDDNPFAKTVIREFIFIRPLETMVVFDRLEAERDTAWGPPLPAEQVVKSFLLHSQHPPVREDSSHFRIVNGNQALRLTTLVPARPRNTIVNDGAFAGTDSSVRRDWYQYRLEVDDSGTAQSLFLTVLQARDAGGANVTANLTDNGASYQVSLSHPTLGSATVVFRKGMASTGGEIGYAASGTPVLTSLTAVIQGISVTDSGPVWGALPAAVEEAGLTAEPDLELTVRPNPFNPAALLTYNVGTQNFASLHIRLVIYNAAGKCVATLVNEPLSLGSHSVQWNAAGFASGVYVVRWQAGGRQASRKILLLR